MNTWVKVTLNPAWTVEIKIKTKLLVRNEKEENARLKMKDKHTI